MVQLKYIMRTSKYTWAFYNRQEQIYSYHVVKVGFTPNDDDYYYIDGDDDDDDDGNADDNGNDDDY